MKRFITFILLSYTVSASGQNLVYNPSFEDHGSCPDNGGQLYKCDNWANATSISGSNYYNSCDPGDMNVPVNYFAGSLPAYSGQAYVGGMYHYQSSSGPDHTKRSYLLGYLTALQVGNCYRVNIHLSKAGYGAPFNVDGWGVFFYKDGYPADSSNIINVHPQIDYNSYGVISSPGWTELSSTFVADSAYYRLMIGIFNPPESTTVTVTGTATQGYSFYFIDSVSVTPLFPALTAGIEPTIIKVFPNPAKDQLQVTGINGEANFQLQDLLGRSVETGSLHNGTNKVVINNIPSGVYTLHIVDSQGKATLHKILKQ